MIAWVDWPLSSTLVSGSPAVERMPMAARSRPARSSTDISVETNSGRVTLSGVVRDQAQVDRAVTTARNIDGVVEVENRLMVGKG